MRVKILTITALAAVISLLAPVGSMAKKWTVTVKQTSFFPYNLTHVRAGDTIQWVWESGVNTTTSGNIPPDAMDWDYSIDTNNKTAIYVPRVNGTYFYFSRPGAFNGQFTVTGASGMAEGEFVRVFAWPNPAKDHLFISLRGGEIFQGEIEIFNASGQSAGIMHDGIISSGEKLHLDVSGLPAGVYIARFGGKGKNAGTFRFVRQ